MNIHRCCKYGERMFVDVMFVCCCISSSNIFISSISDKRTKITKFPSMITNILYINTDSMIIVVRRTSNDVHGWFVSMHKLWWYATIKIDAQTLNDATINHLFCRDFLTVSFIVLLSKRYHRHRTICTTIKFPTNNVYERRFHLLHKITRW